MCVCVCVCGGRTMPRFLSVWEKLVALGYGTPRATLWLSGAPLKRSPRTRQRRDATVDRRARRTSVQNGGHLLPLDPRGAQIDGQHTHSLLQASRWQTIAWRLHF
jgi:hypothetical protein